MIVCLRDRGASYNTDVRLTGLLLIIAAACSAQQRIAVDIADVRPGPIRVETRDTALIVTWPDEAGREWRAEFSLDPQKDLITSIGTGQRSVIERARPLYWATTGKRRGGWDQFFDLPPSHPDGIRQFRGQHAPKSVKATTHGDRVEIAFDGLSMGLFAGGISYTFFPGSRLILQEAIALTQEPDTAYYYDAGLRMMSDADRRAGNNMDSRVAYYDTAGAFREITPPVASERTPVAVRHRMLAARVERGSVAVFPAPHQYFFARDFTSNMEYLWHVAWRGAISIGIRQLPDDNSPFYPWMNAPPGTVQRMGVFFQVSDREPKAVLEEVVRYTNRDKFVPLPGYRVVSSHWHFHYTVQAMEKGLDWVPPFKPVLKDMGVEANIIADFHGDGHPRDLTDVRLKELDWFFKACKAQSDPQFLLIPSEEANVHLGGHWSLMFPKPVYWFMDRPQGTEFRRTDPKYGTVYSVGNASELLDMVRRENGYMYQTHPRTKGSTGFPDKIRETEHFRDPRYIGAGWKAMPSDLSSPRLAERALKLVDDMNNWGLHKRLLGEVDVFQIDSTHELYSHMNVNYVKLARLPGWDNYGQVLDRIAAGDYFITTGEVLLPEVSVQPASGGIAVRARVRWTLPLKFAEIVWGDGETTQRKIIPLDTTRAFGDQSFEWKTDAPNWKWARLAVWDIAGDGAMTNPVRQPAR